MIQLYSQKHVPMLTFCQYGQLVANFHTGR